MNIQQKHGDRWGDWVLNLEEPASLDYIGKQYRNHPYQVVLSQVNTWAGFNNWMRHLSEKDFGWESIGDFVRAVMSTTDLSPGSFGML